MNRLARLLDRDNAPLPGNTLTLLQGGAEYFPALIAAIDAARCEVHVETYIFNPDASGEQVRAALIRAAERGVNVRLLIDGLGTRNVPKSWFAPLINAGNGISAQVQVYHPLPHGWRFRPASFSRMHRKVVVVDACIAFVGGMNLIDDFEPPGHDCPRLDFTSQIEGPLIAPLHADVRRLWDRVTLSNWAGLRARADLAYQAWMRGAVALPRHCPPSWPDTGPSWVAWVTRDNFSQRRSIERSYHAAIAQARAQVDIACAYFLPSVPFRRALTDAARRGVRVRLLVQGVSHHSAYLLASQTCYAELLDAGVELYRYRASELHAKVAVVDQDWATVGSSNIDPFSLLLAREANLVTDDSVFCATLRARFDHAIRDGAEPLDQASWARRSRSARLASRLAYTAVRLLVGLAELVGRG